MSDDFALVVGCPHSEDHWFIETDDDGSRFVCDLCEATLPSKP
jgi:hypothetical protein